MRTAPLLAAMLVCAIPLGGCARLTKAYTTVTTASLTQKKAALGLSAYNNAEGIANIWLAFAPCKAGENYLTTPCRDKGIAAKINAILDKGDPAADQLLADIKSAKAAGHDVYVASTAYDLVMSSKDDLVTATPSSAK